MDVNDPRTTFGDYRIKRVVNETYAGYPYHYLLVPVCLVLVWQPWIRKTHARGHGALLDRDRLALTYAAVVLAGYLLFCTVFKWQLTGNRLHLPFYVAFAPFAGVALRHLPDSLADLRLRRIALPAVMLLLIATSIRPLLINPSRPVIPRAPDGISLWNSSRHELLFVDAPEVLPAYLPLIEAAEHSGCTSFGLVITTHHPEYPLWAILAPPGSGIELQHIDVSHPLRSAAGSTVPCGVLCTYCSETAPAGLNLAFSTHGGYNLYLVPAGDT
jgi:hypothetical protein